MKRYIKADSEWYPYVPPIRRETIDMDWVAKCVARMLTNRNLKVIDIEDVIEAFRMICDDYDDFWGRGLNTKEKKYEFVDELLHALKNYGITDVVDDYGFYED